MMELVLLMGLQGSGKSSFYRARFAESHAHVSKDNFPTARNRDRRQAREIDAALGAGRDVVVDNTNPSAAVRAPVIAQARALGARVVGYYFESDVTDCLARNRGRAGRACVPDVAIFRTARLLERPSLAEGFDALYAVRLAPGGGFVVRPFGEEAAG